MKCLTMKRLTTALFLSLTALALTACSQDAPEDPALT